MDYYSSSYSNGTANWTFPLWVVVSINIVICIFTVLGNLLVIIAYVRDRRIRQITAYTVILNLALTDILVGVFILPIDVVWWITHDWVLGRTVCKLWIIIDYSQHLMSTFTVVYISLDRCWLVSKDLAYQKFQTIRRVIVTLSVTWVVSLIFYSSVVFIVASKSSYESEFYPQTCDLEVAQARWFNIYGIVGEFIVPFSALAVLNYFVYSNIRKRSMELVASGLKVSKNPPKQTILNTVSRRVRFESRRHQSKAEEGLGSDVNNISGELRTAGRYAETTASFVNLDVGAQFPVIIDEIRPRVGPFTDAFVTVTEDDTREASLKPISDRDSHLKETDDNVPKTTTGVNTATSTREDRMGGGGGPDVATADKTSNADARSMGTSSVPWNNLPSCPHRADPARQEEGLPEVEDTPAARGDERAKVDGKLAEIENERPEVEDRQVEEDCDRRRNQYRQDKTEFKRHRKAAKTLAAIVIVYCFCTLPYCTYTVIASFCSECESVRTWEIVSYLNWCKSTINPIIYGLTNSLLQKKFAKLLFVHK